MRSRFVKGSRVSFDLKDIHLVTMTDSTIEIAYKNGAKGLSISFLPESASEKQEVYDTIINAVSDYLRPWYKF